jgi:hypothetical protein
MSLPVPIHRFEQHKDRYHTSLLATSREVSERLGYAGARRSGKTNA